METEQGHAGSTSTSFSELPEGCLSEILSLTSPWDACRASSISRGFRTAADSDGIWDRFLPSDYLDIIARSVSPVNYVTKKQLYFLLCDSPILLDDGNLVIYPNLCKFLYIVQLTLSVLPSVVFLSLLFLPYFVYNFITPEFWSFFAVNYVRWYCQTKFRLLEENNTFIIVLIILLTLLSDTH